MGERGEGMEEREGIEERGREITHTMLTLNKAGPVTTEGGGGCSVLGTEGYGQRDSARSHTLGFEQET